MHNSFIEAEQHIAVKLLITFTDKTQDGIGSRNCIMGIAIKVMKTFTDKTQMGLETIYGCDYMETQIWVNPNT